MFLPLCITALDILPNEPPIAQGQKARKLCNAKASNLYLVYHTRKLSEIQGPKLQQKRTIIYKPSGEEHRLNFFSENFRHVGVLLTCDDF